jgi:hypothetical protein
MPTAAEYRTGANALGAVRDELVHLLRPLTDEVAAVPMDGPFRSTVETALNVSWANVRAAVDELEQRVGEARVRAWMCDDYSRAVRDYWRSADPDRRWPSRPGSWAEYG